MQSAQPIARVALERVPAPEPVVEVAPAQPAPVDTDLGWEDDEAPTEIAPSKPVLAPTPEPTPPEPEPEAAAPPSKVRTASLPATTFGAGMLKGRKARSPQPMPEPVTPEPSAPSSSFGAGMLKGRRTAQPEPVMPEPSAPSSSFGAGMLQSRKVRAKPSAPVALIEPTGASTFGAGMLQQRRSRAPFVMALIVAVAAIAVLVLSYR